MVRTWSENGQNVLRCVSERGQKMFRKWSENGQEIVRKLSEHGQNMVRQLSENGQKIVRQSSAHRQTKTENMVRIQSGLKNRRWLSFCMSFHDH